MKKITLKQILPLMILLGFFATSFVSINAQCIRTTAFGTVISNNSGVLQGITTCLYTTAEYSTVTGLIVGKDYTFNVQEGTTYGSGNHKYVTITDLTNNVIQHGPSPVTLVNVSVTGVRIHTSDDASCAGSASCHNTSVLYLASCMQPTALSASNLTTTTADVSWVASTTVPANGYDYYYSTVNTAPTAATTPTGNVASGVIANLSGLSAGTQYYAWVRSNCSVSDQSTWAGPLSFSTVCNEVTSFVENFEAYPSGINSLPVCWSRGGTSAGTYITTGSLAPMSPTKRIYMFASGTTPSEGYLILPAVSNLQLNTHRLKFKAFSSSGTDRYLEVGYLTDPTDVNTFMILEEIAIPGPTVSSTQEFTIVPTGVPAGTKNLVIKNPGFPSASTTAYLDDFKWEAIPSCPEPTAITAINVTATSAQLSWTEGGAATTWNIEYGITGFAQGSGTLVNGVTTNPYSIVTLPATSYSYYVQADCAGTNGVSVWVGPFTFSTPCLPYTIPYFEGFESGYTHNTAALGCLQQVSITGTTAWRANNTFTDYNRTPRTGSWNTFLQYGNEDWLFIPIDLVGGTSYTVQFYARQDGTVATDSNIAVSYGSSPSAAGMIDGVVPATNLINGGYQLITGDFTPTTTGTYYVGIKGFMNSSPWYISLDDIKIDVTPSCIPPISLTASNITNGSADLAWTEAGASTVWDIEWGTAGFTPTGTPNIAATTLNPTSLPGLTPNTAYSFYVRAKCGGANGDSPWSGPFTFSTLCNPYTIPYLEGFESGYTHNTAVAGCLTQQSITAAEVWSANSSFTDYNRTPRTGSWNAFLRYGNEDWLFIPIELIGGTSYTVDLYARQDGATAGNANMLVSYGTSATAAAMTNSIVPATGIINGDYQLVSGAFTPATNGTYYVGIKGFMNFSPYYISLDDISINVTPDCLAPVSLTATNISSTSADLGWTENGTATVWDVEWGTSGFTPTGVPNIAATTLNPTNLPGLTSNTSYSFYVRALCGGTSGESTWSGPFNFITGCSTTNVPYVMNFETAAVPSLPNCTTQQNVGTGNLWSVANNPGFGFTTNTLRYSYDSFNDANVWFYTQAINLTAGTTYAIAFDYGGSPYGSYVEKLKVSYGTSADAAAMTTLIVDLPNIVNETPLNSLTQFTPTTSGVYYFGFNAYSNQDENALFVDNINVDVYLNANTFDNSNFVAYPNPVKDILNLSYSSEITSVKVINLLGQEVISRKVNNTSSQIDMSNLTAGAYIVNVTIGDVVKTIKVIKQ